MSTAGWCCYNDSHCHSSTLIYQVLTCFSVYGLAEDAGALAVTGRDRQCIRFAALEPCEHMECPVCGVRGIGPTVFLRVDKVVSTTFWTWVPAHCDIIVAASCPPDNTGWRADN